MGKKKKLKDFKLLLGSVAESSGWSDTTVLELLSDFIVERGLSDECLNFLEDISGEEDSLDAGNI